MIHESIALLGAVTLIALAFGVLRLWQRRTPAPSAELVRKAAHITTGMLAVSFPWLFRSDWPVLALCAGALSGMIAMRVVPALRTSVGRVTGSVERRSWGELYFPLAVACVWLLSGHDKVLYVVPILLLTLGDAAAALVGAAFGRHKFRTTEGRKSVEGSLAFVAVSGAATMIALTLLAPGLEPLRALLIAVLLACLLMVFEAIAWRGLDNLLLPVMAFLLLRLYLKLELPDLAVRIGAFTIILALLVAIRERRTLTGEGVLAAALFLYGAWALGGWSWLVPPAIIVVAAPWLPRHHLVPSVAIHGVFPVAALSTAGLVLLMIHSLTGADNWPSYAANFGAALSMVTCIQLHPHPYRWPRKRVLAASVALGVPLVIAPSLLIARVALSGAGRVLVLALVASFAACGLAFMPFCNRLAGEKWVWLLRGAALALGAGCVAGLEAVLPGSF